MIGCLRGIMLEKHPPQVLIEIHGVGYEVYLPMNCFCILPEIGQEAIIHTHLIIREDAQLLFGFLQKQERMLFRELIKVNGVGPKLALTILSEISAQRFVSAVVRQDTNTLVTLSGIGEKTAKRLIVEMQDRLKDLFHDLPFGKELPSVNRSSNINPEREAIAALVVLGYKVQEASRMVKEVTHASADCETLIRDALRISL